MKRSRAVLTAVAATAALTFAATAAQAGSPLSSHLASPTTAEAVPPTVSAQEEKAPVPEPVSMALLGIGISSLITFRRFCKLFS